MHWDWVNGRGVIKWESGHTQITYCKLKMEIENLGTEIENKVASSTN
jgi:hypothetical protein